MSKSDLKNGNQPVAEKLPANIEHEAPTDWAVASRSLSEGQWYWLATVRPDGLPHVRPILAVWLDGKLHFVSGSTTRKGKNLESNSHCSISVATDEIHLVVEGKATKVRDEAKLQRVADEYASKYDWPVTVREGVFYADYGAPTAGPPPYEVYELTPRMAFAFGTGETFSPTRWRF